MQWKWNTWGQDPQATAEDPERLLTLAIAYEEEREQEKWAWNVTNNKKQGVCCICWVAYNSQLLSFREIC